MEKIYLEDNNMEQIRFEDDNMETEEDLGQQLSSDYTKAVLWGTDWTTETIVSQMKKKNIDLNPDFQRRDAWDKKKKSKFIESLILGLPVPPIILAESKDKKNSYIVIDGKQRLLSIMQFCSTPDDIFEPLYLYGLEILSGINGCNYEKLEQLNDNEDYRTQFDNQSIRTSVIRNWNSENFLYTVFLRLNTGSLKLSPQELRQALHPGDFVTFTNEYTKESYGLKTILKLTKPDPRMRDVELLIRYFSFKYFEETYKGNLKQFLDDTCKKLNETWNTKKDEYISQAEELEESIIFTLDVFDKKSAFSKFLDGKYTNIFNRTVFDLFSITFSEVKSRKKFNSKKDSIKKAFEELMSSDSKFLASVSGSTKDLDKTKYRFKAWRDKLESV